jgi:hypothetical protein
MEDKQKPLQTFKFPTETSQPIAQVPLNVSVQIMDTNILSFWTK